MELLFFEGEDNASLIKTWAAFGGFTMRWPCCLWSSGQLSRGDDMKIFVLLVNTNTGMLSSTRDMTFLKTKLCPT